MSHQFCIQPWLFVGDELMELASYLTLPLARKKSYNYKRIYSYHSAHSQFFVVAIAYFQFAHVHYSANAVNVLKSSGALIFVVYFMLRYFCMYDPEFLMFDHANFVCFTCHGYNSPYVL